MFFQLKLSPSTIYTILALVLRIVVTNGQDYDSDAFPDEDKRISRERFSNDMPAGLKTSTVIKISPENPKPNENDILSAVQQRDTSEIIAIEKKLAEQGQVINDVEETLNTIKEDLEVKKEAQRPDNEVIISHTPNTKLHPPVVSETKVPIVTANKKGKEKTIMKQKLSQKPSRVAVDVKEKKDKHDPSGKKQWETNLVVEGKPLKTPNPDIVLKQSNKASDDVEVISSDSDNREVIEVKPKPEVADIPAPVEVVEVKPKPEVADIPAPVEVDEVKPKPEVADIPAPVEIVKVIPPHISNEVIDIENMGKDSKLITAMKEGKGEIITQLRDGLLPNFINWAEQAIAEGIENVVNAVENKYIAYIQAKSRRTKREVIIKEDDDDDDNDDEDAKSSLTHALKKVQQAAKDLATSGANSAAQQASAAAKLNMDVSKTAASNAVESVASAIGAASENAANNIVAAENAAAAAALAAPSAGIDPMTPGLPVVVPSLPPSPLSLDELAAGGGAGKDLIQQTLQIQKGLNLVMRAVLKEKERVAADLARYQNKISFLLREMAGAPVEVVAIAGKPVDVVKVKRRRRRRQARRQRRAIISTNHLRQMLEHEESRLNEMLRSLDVTMRNQNHKTKRELDAVCQHDYSKKRSRTKRLKKCTASVRDDNTMS